MAITLRTLSIVTVFTGSAVLFSFNDGPDSGQVVNFPYKQSGLTTREAAAHLLSRFSFGALPGQVDEVSKLGPEKWFEQQLKADLKDDVLNQRLQPYDALAMSNEKLLSIYPRMGAAVQMAIRDGVISADSATVDMANTRRIIKPYLAKKGLRLQTDLADQLYDQKILRAALSRNQLKEVLTDFWFNHFNVALSKLGVQLVVIPYERDVIRANAMGKFGKLLLATAKSPAMLLYLDNTKNSQKKGLNENYAREIMELHTLGVDGGYTQTDVTEAARVLTGWRLHPRIETNQRIKELLTQDILKYEGCVEDGDFLFAMNNHDKDEKVVLKHKFPAGGGYEEGVELINMLAHHPSTAKFISKKLATRFVSDNPPATLIDKMAKTFLSKDGDIKEVLTTMVNSPEFWSKSVMRQKTKSPFELVISTIRTTGSEIKDPTRLLPWFTRMGQRLYDYPAPTGFPDRAQYWINTGALLNRMNFGMAFASYRVGGVKTDLLRLNNNHEPESPEAALKTYFRVLLPERDEQESIKRLTPMIKDPHLDKKLEAAADQTESTKASKIQKTRDEMAKNPAGPVLAQVVGIIIGSPEFQRR